MWVVLAVMIVIFVVWMYLSSKKRKKQEDEANKLIDAVKPGNKVKTIGGICGIVVEVDPEEKTFVLETGSETSGKSYIKFDRQAIYQTDAVVEKEDDKNGKDDKDGKDEAVAETEVKEVKSDEPADANEPAEENTVNH